MKTKRCSRCGKHLPLEMFRHNHQTDDGYVSYCKNCMAKTVNVPDGYKQCRKCGEIKPLREFHKKKASPDGYRNHCKVCRSKHEGIGYKKPAPKGFRYCSKCGELKPATQEYYLHNPNSFDGCIPVCHDCRKKSYLERREELLEIRRKRYEENKDEINAARREAYADDPEKVLSSHRAWAERNPEKVKAMSRRYYHENRERIIERVGEYQSENPDKVRKWHRKRYYKNLKAARSRARLYRNQRKSREADLPTDFSEQDWRYALEYFDHSCAICGRKPDGDTVLAMDHWIALSDDRPDNPGTVAENIVPLCHGQEGCNLSKGSRDPEEWLIWKFGEEFALEMLAKIEVYFEHVRERKSDE